MQVTIEPGAKSQGRVFDLDTQEDISWRCRRLVYDPETGVGVATVYKLSEAYQMYRKAPDAFEKAPPKFLAVLGSDGKHKAATEEVSGRFEFRPLEALVSS